ncbi:hypothetical protein NC652_005278 [Populus alba x Populus x berolinensis]|uniref:Uncharacterized protein n=1 Tax=Populus alba x Populus x berolinensis TaxID=444605 RepID=A0AAD6WAI6_9ROSI|nr:hypothetical protein NC652_005278 [Populus alba x Populus x berolinensis]KAJ7005519.1 hypothetical protein NC653_004977 [Populus alba x Populus x berolinensis]KAJ7005525.1 hypothetical protein NC653_004983 [Populus alba x Populus x berolinensis]
MSGYAVKTELRNSHQLSPQKNQMVFFFFTVMNEVVRSSIADVATWCSTGSYGGWAFPCLLPVFFLS